MVLEAMDPSGTPLWSVPYDGRNVPQVFTAGPRIFELDDMSETVSVFDRTGHPLGHGDAPNADDVFSPTTSQWAWSTDDGVTPSPLPSSGTSTRTGSFWVAGVGEPAHKVYTWSETESAQTVSSAVDALTMWSDQGLVSSQPPPWAGCADEHQSASYVVNPVTGARTDLARDAVVDVRAGVVVSAPPAGANAPQSLVLSGRTSFTWTNSADGYYVVGASVSPLGSTVAVGLLSPAGCTGSVPEAQTALISVANHSVRFIAGALAERCWLDDTHMVATVNLGTNQLDVVGIDGTRSPLGHGQCGGVLTSS